MKELPADFPLPLIIIQHRSRDERTLLEEVLQAKCMIRIKQADEKEKIAGGVVYFAPADYHLLIEKDRSFSLNCDEPVNFSRPSIDLLFETASEVYRNNLIGIILTGASRERGSGHTGDKRAGWIYHSAGPRERVISGHAQGSDRYRQCASCFDPG